jgi:Tetratricopeptide repeat/Tetratrico peptide repeat
MFRTAIMSALSFALCGGGMLYGEEKESREQSELVEADKAFKNGDFKAALKAYQWYRVDANLGPQARIQSGHCHLKLGNLPAAVREWRSVRESYPISPLAASALALEIQNTKDATGRKKLEDLLLTAYADTVEAKAMLASRAKENATANTKVTPETELDQLLAAGKREEAEKLLISTARRATGDERDYLFAQLAAFYESTGDWRKAAGAWRRIAEEGNVEYRDAATFDWIRTTAAIGKNQDGVEDMWRRFLRDFPNSPRGYLAVTRLAEMMRTQGREDEAASLLSEWLETAEEKSPGADFVSKHLADLQKQAEAEKVGSTTTFSKDRLEAIAKLPAELDTLCDLAKSGKGSGKILNRIRDIRRGVASSEVTPTLLLRLDLAEALALIGLGDTRKALGLLDGAWTANSEPHSPKDAAREIALAELATEAIGIAVESADHRAAIVWAERIAVAAPVGSGAAVSTLKEASLRLILTDAKEEGVEMLTILGERVLARLPEDSRLRKEETAALARLKTLCANGKAIPDNEWFVGELPLVRDSRIARELFGADILFAARETEKASRAYAAVILKAGLDKETEGYATLQMARCLAAIGEHEQALRTYRHFESSLAATKSAPPALIRAGTLCAGSMNDSKSAVSLFRTVSARYPASPEAELCDWYAATLLLWEGDRRASRSAFDEFEKKHPQSPFIKALNSTIRPQL